MFYRLVRAIVAFALGLFYRLEVQRRAADLSGPVMFVGNHPNSLIDPALVFVITDRPVTFLAREPLFRAPILGWVLRGLGALPVFRKQDHPGKMEQNEGTLAAAAGALLAAKAITIFPEGRSHSEPQLSDLKTGCARIALRVARAGSALRVVPIGLTYAQKHRFKSRVHLEVGEPILVQAAQPSPGGEEVEWVRALTQRVGEALRQVTLNLEEWDDLDLVETADQLFALRNGYREKDPERLRMIARGASLVRREQPERFDELKEDLMSFRTRLELVAADPQSLQLEYRRTQVVAFALRNLASLLFGMPLFGLGLVLFAVPFMAVRLASAVAPLSRDRVATLKLVASLALAPAWWALLVALGLWGWGLPGAAVAALGALPLALFTRYFLDRWRNVLADIFVFLKLGNRSRLKQHLLFEGERLQEEIQQLVGEFKAKVEQSGPQQLPPAAGTP